MIEKTHRFLIITLFCGYCGLFAVLSGCEDNTGLERSAVAASEQWLAMIDAGHYQSCWKESSDLFKNAGNRSKWMKSMRAVRLPMGKTLNRRLKNARFKKSLPKAPRGQYVVVNFQTEFANKKEAIETIASVLDPDGQWRVAGYHIQ